MRAGLRTCAIIVLAALLSGAAGAGYGANAEAPRLAIISAFEPEWKALIGFVESPQTQRVHGVPFVTGTIAGKPVVLMMSGVSMVNAAMNTQLLLDHFVVTGIVFSGIAGGADPALRIGDVVVPERWRQSLETIIARETPNGYAPLYFDDLPRLPGFGMMFPNSVAVGNAVTPTTHRAWFEADPGLLAVARRVAQGVELQTCVAPTRCLDHVPRVVVGGAGVSGPAFVDNRSYRTYLHGTFEAEVIDMESAAVGQVAFANQVPFIAFRSLSDLAGGDETENQMHTFMDLAAQNSATVVIAFINALSP